MEGDPYNHNPYGVQPLYDSLGRCINWFKLPPVPVRFPFEPVPPEKQSLAYSGTATDDRCA